MSNKFSINQVEQLLKSTRNKNNYKNFNLSLYAIHYLLENNNAENVISYVNKLFKTSRHDEVYLYLDSVVACISKDLLFDNISFWMQCVVEKSNEKSSERFTIISNLIQIGKENQDFNKLMHSSLLFRLIEECLCVQIDAVYIGAVLNCLATCLEAYSSSCGHIKTKIELYLIQFLHVDTINTKLVKFAALCYQKLQKAGNAGMDSINYKNNWKTSFEKLCVTIDMLYNSFFEDIDEFFHYEKLTMDPYTLPELPKIISSTEVLYAQESRLLRTSIFLRGMLENEFSHSKCIRPQYILDIITRVLSIHLCVNSNNSDTSFHLGMLLIKTQTSILYVLRSVIAVLELNLLLFSATISKLLINSLERIQKCNCFRSANDYIEALYKVLDYWIKTLGNCLNANVHDKIIHIIIGDISPITTDVSLSISNTKDCISGKAKKRAMQEKIISSSTKHSKLENYSESMLNNKVKNCCRALSCLSMLLKNVNLTLKDNTVTLLYNTLIQATLAVQNGKELFPYRNDNVKIKLFEALVNTLECSKIPPSIELIINILREGQKTNNATLLYHCSMGLNVLEKICHPVCPSLNFVSTARSISNPDETVKELEDISQDLEESANDDEETCETYNLKDSNVFTENVAEVDDSNVVTNVENNEDTNTIQEETLDEKNSKENNVEESSSVTDTQQEENTNDKKENIEIVEERDKVSSNISLVENDSGEPVHKKIKMDIITTDPDIDEMLSAFVDEVSDDVK